MKNNWIKILGRRVDITYIVGYVVKKHKAIPLHDNRWWKLTISYSEPINESIEYLFETKENAEKLAAKLDKYTKPRDISRRK